LAIASCLVAVAAHGSPPATPERLARNSQAGQYPKLGYSHSQGAVGLVEKSIYSAEYQRLCGFLRQLRREAGLTQVQVAERLDVPQSFVSKYESGERRLDAIELLHVVRALDSTLLRVAEFIEEGE
jgi:DNA-binding transcriptional regulator YiaG